MRAVCSSLPALALAAGAASVSAQTFHYVDPEVAACPAPPPPSTAAAKAVRRGVPVPGRLSVTCGLDEGSYTVTLSSTDPGARFSPKSFVVNFGRISGNGAFTVTFATVGVQRIATNITSNMGSPAARGRFASASDEVEVMNP